MPSTSALTGVAITLTDRVIFPQTIQRVRVLDSIKQQRMFAIALDNRVKTMNNEIVRIDVKMCQAFGIQPDMDRIARADGQKDARKD